MNLGQQPEPPESEPMERGAGQVSHPDKPIHPPDRDNAGGSISNRPLSEEERNQRDLPRRGQAKDEYESPFKV